ncbi:MAG: zinc metallopeptidase [Dehalococcoidia bacterium]|nr:zinc metallopeptidase [Dehalococcoidia bacterium]
MFFFDPMYLLFAAPAMLVMLYAQARVRSAYGKYAKVPNMSRVNGLDVARKLVGAFGLQVMIEEHPGTLTDHYDPRRKALRFSRDIYNTPSVASLGIVAHEVGHALQDHYGYAPMRLRSALVPVTNIGTKVGYVFFFLGIIIGMSGFVWLGIILFSAAVLFSLATLPVELDASRRAKQMLTAAGLVTEEESQGVNAVLSAAALTYVAALLQAVATLLYFVYIAMGSRR